MEADILKLGGYYKDAKDTKLMSVNKFLEDYNSFN